MQCGTLGYATAEQGKHALGKEGGKQSDDYNRRNEVRLYGLHGKDSLAGTYGRSIPKPQYVSRDGHFRD
jgi:hypothetical protein